MTRRQLLLAAMASSVPEQPSAQIPIFDFHCQPPFPTHSATILANQRAFAIRASALLPINSASAHTVLPSFNIARASAVGTAANFPGEFVPFTIADPRKRGRAQALRRDREAGASGIGELEFPVACDSPGWKRSTRWHPSFKSPS